MNKVTNILLGLCFVVLVLNGCGGDTSLNSDKTSPIAQQKELIQGQWWGTCISDSGYLPESIFHVGNSLSLHMSSFEIDGESRPHILYNDRYKYKMFYCSIYNGSDWITLDGATDEYGDCYVPLSPDGNLESFDDMKLDSKDKNHFIRRDKEGLVYLIWNGTGWETIDDKNPKIDGITGLEIKYPTSYKDTDYQVQLTLDSQDRPNIVFYKGYTYKEKMSYIHFVRWNGSQWITSDGKEYDHESNDGLIYISDKSVNQLELLLDRNDNPYVVWSEEVYPNLIYIKGTALKNGEWKKLASPLGVESYALVDLRDKFFYPNIYDFQVKIDKKDRFHLSWEYKETDDSHRTFCYMVRDDVSNEDTWKSIDGNRITGNLISTNVPVSIEHIDESGYLHHIEPVFNDKIDLAYTMWNGDQWISVEGRPVPPEGDEDCIFYRNYNDRPPTDFIIRTHNNNLYVMWYQWSQDGVGVGVSENLHYMEWIEDNKTDKN